MMTLDTLARMADRMPATAATDELPPSDREGSLPWGHHPYRLAEPVECRVCLPTIRQEAGRGLQLFVRAVLASTLVVTLAGITVCLGNVYMSDGALAPWPELARAAVWYGGVTLLFMTPFAGFGIVSQLARFARIRRLFGPEAVLTPTGELRSLDGQTTEKLS